MKPTMNDSKILYVNGEFIGINLGWDFTAEHEWGIRGIYDAFGVDGMSESGTLLYGLDRYKIKRNFSELDSYLGNYYFCDAVADNKEYSVLGYLYQYKNTELFNPSGTLKSNIFKKMEFGLYQFGKKDAVALWDERNFAICVERKNRAVLAELKDAFDRKDVSIFLMPKQNPFGGTGLCVVITSKAKETPLGNQLTEIDKNAERLQKAKDDSGIVEILKKAGKRYYALSPRWDKEGKLIFWLNPMEQRQYESGWFTVEELKEWAQDKGPVIKQKNRNV